ncbi:MAG: ASKHA domain-containing protein [Candidatus Aminicenantes bacterium]|nr:ASKHA domain-containing protein [Candidatus Aminicenantes bacterium]
MPQKYHVQISPSKKEIIVEENTLLSEAIQRAGIHLRMDCSKLGLCGKCLVKISDGLIPPIQEHEESFLLEKNLDKTFRLACLFPIKSDLKIDIPNESLLQELNILKTGIKTPVTLDPPIKKFFIQLPRPSVAEPISFIELFQTILKKPILSVPLEVLETMPSILERNNYKITAVIHKDSEIIAIEGGNTSFHCYGFAIDLGTTTLVVELIDLNSGKSIDTIALKNSQTQYGSDVISRIGYSISDESNLEELKGTVLADLNTMIATVLSRNNIPSSSIYEIVLSGNTTMNHILLGLPLKSLAQTPFNALFSSLPELPANSSGFNIHRSGKLFIVPNIRSFVGGDISAGLIASDLLKKKGNFLFIDLGTNGEIVLKTDSGSVATSTAAGPAFEGMNISCGMLALPGAIYKVRDGKSIQPETIQNQSPLGICGTGLIDAVAVSLNLGFLSPKGKILNDSGKIVLTENIFLSQKDIREVQLAVAAIRSGIRMIMEKKNLSLDLLDGIFIAGAFGNYLNISNSIQIGLLPAIPEEKIHFVGNSSLAGAKALLISSSLRTESNSLSKKIEFLSLATNVQFQEYFVDSLDFPA